METVNVAVVRSDNRRGAVAQALALVAGEVTDRVAPEVVVKPNLVSHRRQLPSTHADTLSATLDFLFAAGADRAVIAEGASDANEGFHRFGHQREALGRRVGFFDINKDENRWESIELEAADGSMRTARLSSTVASSPCRVSLALAKTHVSSILTFSLKNMLSSLHPADRVMMHGYAPGGNGYSGWRGRVVEFLKGDDPIVNVLTRSMGRARIVQGWLSGKWDRDSAWWLSPREMRFLNDVNVLNRNLVRLSRRVKPHISVVDGFLAMHREGPRHGTPIRLRTVVAGTDAVAVDAVAAAVMGFEPRAIGHIAMAENAGLGVADLDRINVVGDPIASVRRRCVPHSNYAIQRHWDKVEVSAIPAPHPAPTARKRVRNA